MTASTRTVLKAFGMRRFAKAGVHSPEELKLIVSASRGLEYSARRTGGTDPARARSWKNITVREIMVPRPDIFSVPGNLTLEEALQHVVDEQHSRVPVFDPQRGPEHIIGVLYAKDLMRWLRYRVNRTAIGAPGHAAQRAGSSAHHARGAGRAGDQASARPADGVQGPQTSSRGGGRRIRHDGGSRDRRGRAGTVGGRD